MKKVNKTLFVNVTNSIICGNGSFTADVIHQVIVYKNNEGEVDVDVDFLDIENITFMGMPINGYTEFKKFKGKMLEMGIDIDGMVDEECVGIISNEFINQYKEDFKKII